jgi:hypothetical protein
VLCARRPPRCGPNASRLTAIEHERRDGHSSEGLSARAGKRATPSGRKIAADDLMPQRDHEQDAGREVGAREQPGAGEAIGAGGS